MSGTFTTYWEFMMKIVIATTTFYSGLDKLRAQLALQTVKEIKEAGLSVVVVDESPAPVAQALELAGGIVVQQETPGMGAGRRQALRKAAELAGESGYVVWTEPEKTGLAQYWEQIVSSLPNADIIVPSRNREGMESYPDYQQYAEMLGNKAFELITGCALDMWIGPRIVRTSACHFFLNYAGEYGDRWDSIFIPVIRAIKAGLTVTSSPVSFLYTPEQRQDEENNFPMLEKRIVQLTTLVEAIKKEWNES